MIHQIPQITEVDNDEKSGLFVITPRWSKRWETNKPNEQTS